MCIQLSSTFLSARQINCSNEPVSENTITNIGYATTRRPKGIIAFYSLREKAKCRNDKYHWKKILHFSTWKLVSKYHVSDRISLEFIGLGNTVIRMGQKCMNLHVSFKWKQYSIMFTENSLV